MSDAESRYDDSRYDLAVEDGRIEKYAINVSVTTIIGGVEIEGSIDFTHHADRGSDIDYGMHSLDWLERNCDMDNIAWYGDCDEILEGMDLKDVEDLAEEFNYDIDYSRV